MRESGRFPVGAVSKLASSRNPAEPSVERDRGSVTELCRFSDVGKPGQPIVSLVTESTRHVFDERDRLSEAIVRIGSTTTTPVRRRTRSTPRTEIGRSRRYEGVPSLSRTSEESHHSVSSRFQQRSLGAERKRVETGEQKTDHGVPRRKQHPSGVCHEGARTSGHKGHSGRVIAGVCVPVFVAITQQYVSYVHK